MRVIGLHMVTITALLLSGCITDVANRYYATERFEPRPTEEIQVLTEAPKQDYDIIADFQARGATVEYMRKRAAEIGADAVIVGTFGGYRAKSDEWASEDKYATSYSRITGTAIKYKSNTKGEPK